jgi:hypothetical protein
MPTALLSYRSRRFKMQLKNQKCPTCGSKFSLIKFLFKTNSMFCQSCGKEFRRVLSPVKIIGGFFLLWDFCLCIYFGVRPLYLYICMAILYVLKQATVISTPFTLREIGKDKRQFIRLALILILFVITMCGLGFLKTCPFAILVPACQKSQAIEKFK